MDRGKSIAVLFYLLLFVGSTVAQEKPKAAVKMVSADAEFLEYLADFQLIQAEISRIEHASGIVTITFSVADLQSRATVKEAKMREWMSKHAMTDKWQYDPTKKMFSPPAAEVKKGDTP